MEFLKNTQMYRNLTVVYGFEQTLCTFLCYIGSMRDNIPQEEQV